MQRKISIKQFEKNKMIIKQDNKELPYESPQMTTIPLRTSEMLCVSGGMFTLTNEGASQSDWLYDISYSGALGDGSGSSNPGNSASDPMTLLDNSSGWDNSF